VVIGDNVEIGANCCVDRATLGETTIGAGTKIDNHVQIAHNCRIGKNVIIAGQEAVGGSSVIADNVIIGGGGAVTDNVTIGPGVIIGGFSGVHRSITEPGAYSGSLVMKHQAYKKFMLSGKRLDKLEKRLKEWEQREKKRELER